MKKQFALLLTLVLMVGVIAACGSNANNNGTNNSAGNGAESNNAGNDSGGSEKKKIALVLPEQIGVNPFYSQMDEGLQKAGEEFGIEVKTIESTDIAAFEQNLRTTVAEDYDLIMTATFNAVDALGTVAAENPDKSFAIIDDVVDQPNVRSVVFREYEAAFLMGAAAGLSTKTNKVGAVAAIDAPIIHKFTKSFEAGLAHTNPNAEYEVNYVNSFVDTAKAKEIAIQQHAWGADFIAGMAAVSDLGVFEAAKEKGFYTSGQDIDRTVEDPEHIVLSQLKFTDTAAYETAKAFAGDSFEFGTVDYGLLEEGVGVTFVTHESTSPLSPFIGQDVIDQVKVIAEEIKSGKLEVKNPLAQ
ncbi:BMP family lipoprotein [Paenibacillus chungangensis]|uniref:BMP family protein n=1 Tax=Paenibacillus chungangensis TaxID=696535 RepID=A0ABW3HTW0_9BACL